jgi:RNA polymerase sigma-70 factor (ECF subfamily)
MTEQEQLRTPEGFTAFYRRHAPPLTAFFLRRTGDAEVTADLVAETFAAALTSVKGFDPDRGPAVAWLYGIARNQLGSAQRRGRVEDRARRRLGMEPLQLTDAAIERVEALAAAEGTARALNELMGDLPPEQRAAVEARVVHELDYAEIATASDASETVIRQRVSRGLSRLRSGLKGGAL